MSSLSTILLTWNNWEMTMKRLSELYAMLPPESELVWVDNGSYEEDFIANMKWWIDALNKKLKLKFYRFRENTGFGVGNNKGAEIATGDVFLFLSNDVIIKQKFYKSILDVVLESPKTMFAGRLIDWEAGWNEFIRIDGSKLNIPYAEGWCLAATRDLWEDVGGFDPIYTPADFEDVDLSYATLQKGYSLATIPLAENYFSHIGGQTANKYIKDRMSLTKTNQAKFCKKWKVKIA